jgi:hypothetical protein
MRRTSLRFRAALLLTAAALSMVAADHSHAQRAVRCFDLALGQWETAVSPARDSLLFSPPPRILLDTVVVQRGPHAAGYLLREAPGSLPSVHRLSYWQTSRDSVELVWSTGFAGLSARLHAGRDTLRGVARTFAEPGGSPQTETVVLATRVDCDDPPVFDLRAQRRIPLGVRLASGDSVKLGQHVQELESLELESSRGAARLEAPLARPFTAARDVQLLPDEHGRIEFLRFVLPPGSEWERVLRAVAAQYGPPTSRSSARMEDLETETVDWFNRTAVFSMHRSRSPGEPWHTSVVISTHRFRL